MLGVHASVLLLFMCAGAAEGKHMLNRRRPSPQPNPLVMEGVFSCVRHASERMGVIEDGREGMGGMCAAGMSCHVCGCHVCWTTEHRALLLKQHFLPQDRVRMPQQPKLNWLGSKNMCWCMWAGCMWCARPTTTGASWLIQAREVQEQHY